MKDRNELTDEQREKRLGRRTKAIAASIVTFWLGWGIALLAFGSFDGLGELGDAFNVATSLFTALAFGGVVVALMYQHHEYTLQLKEFTNLTESASETAKLQRETVMVQRVAPIVAAAEQQGFFGGVERVRTSLQTAFDCEACTVIAKEHPSGPLLVGPAQPLASEPAVEHWLGKVQRIPLHGTERSRLGHERGRVGDFYVWHIGGLASTASNTMLSIVNQAWSLRAVGALPNDAMRSFVGPSEAAAVRLLCGACAVAAVLTRDDPRADNTHREMRNAYEMLERALAMFRPKEEEIGNDYGLAGRILVATGNEIQQTQNPPIPSWVRVHES